MIRSLKLYISLCVTIALLLTSFMINATNISSYRVHAQASQPIIPVLLFHRVVDNATNEWTDTDTEKFKSIIAYLAEHHYTTLSSEQYDAIMSGKMDAPEKPILLTFDDGTIDFLHTIVPILEQYEMQSILFLIPGMIRDAQTAYLSHEQLQLIVEQHPSVSIENHTYLHEYNMWNTISEEDATSRLNEANKYIEKLTGKPVLMLAYPYGEFNEATKKAAANLNIKYGFKGWGANGSDNYEMGRHYIKIDTTLNQIAAWIGGPAPSQSLPTSVDTQVSTNSETNSHISSIDLNKIDRYTMYYAPPDIKVTVQEEPNIINLKEVESKEKDWITLLSIIIFIALITTKIFFEQWRNKNKR